jgi:hypothetical protein
VDCFVVITAVCRTQGCWKGGATMTCVTRFYAPHTPSMLYLLAQVQPQILRYLLP